MKGRADQPADAAGHARDDEPLEKRADELPHGARFPFGLFFHIVHGDGVLFMRICAANRREQKYYTTEFAEIPPPYLIFFAGLVIIIRAFAKCTYMDRYRSGHNGPDSKFRQKLGISSP